jgi:hypothetical protein
LIIYKENFRKGMSCLLRTGDQLRTAEQTALNNILTDVVSQDIQQSKGLSQALLS